MEKVVIIMGSKADLEWAEKIVAVLKSFDSSKNYWFNQPSC